MKLFKFIFIKYFNKIVNYLFINKNIFENNNIDNNLFSHVIMLYINIFNTRIKLRIFNQNYNFLIIIIENDDLY